MPATSFFRNHPSAIFTWIDKQSQITFNMNARYMAEMAKLIAEGLIIPVDGGFKGLYTFVNQSGTYSVAPAQGHECAKSRRKNFEKA